MSICLSRSRKTTRCLRKAYPCTRIMRVGARRSGVVIGWALRWALVWGGIAVLCIAAIERGGALLSRPPVAAAPGPSTGSDAETASAPPVDSLSYPVDANGHVIVEAEVDGAMLHLLVDTGASLVSLTPADARAAGIEPDRLAYTGRAATANGLARMAPVTLRAIRIGQLTVENVPAAVLENLNLSLLGMSFLSRLRSYRMADGRFTIAW
jgi:aspartyl protease family protein